MRFTRRSLLPPFGLIAYVVGVVARWSYILGAHHPRHFVRSDALPILGLAEVLVDPTAQQQFLHTIWPPGASAFFALNLLFDPTLATGAAWQFLLSSLAPLLVAQATRWAHGARAGWIALALASLHFGFIHYGGFFLSEQLFQFAVAVAVWATVGALLVEGRRWRIVGGVASGAGWALAFSFRPNALPIALGAAAWLGARWLRRRERARLAGLAAGAVALLLVWAPLTHRCTSLVGRFCPGASNFAMNVALGHAPPGVAGLHFKPQSTERASGPNSWYPPARLHHGYSGSVEVPASLYDTGRVLGWVKGRLFADPGEFAVASVGNALDLFGTEYWPDEYGTLEPRRATVCKQLFFIFAIIPGVALFGVLLVRLARRTPLGEVTVFSLAVLAGLFALAAFSLGEARYRLPFDVVIIMFAARALMGRAAAPGEENAEDRPVPVAPGWLGAAAVGLVLANLTLVATAHPQVQLAARLSRWVSPRRSPAHSAITRPLDALATLRPAGSAWDAAGNVVFTCDPDCPDLRLDLGGVRHDRAIEASSDHNDRYEVQFSRAGRPVDRVAWGPFQVGERGLRVVRNEIPDAVRSIGFDALTIRPLYGDGRYAIGHVRLE